MNRPPQWPLRLIRAICPRVLHEEIEGDLIEQYHLDRSRMGRRPADIRFILAACHYFRPGIIMRNRFKLKFMNMHLLGNNVRMAFRTLRHDRLFSVVNLFGISASMAATLLILQYAFFELNYDRGQGQPENIYRIYTSTYYKGEPVGQSALTASTLGSALSDIPEIRQAGRIYSTRNWFDCTLSYLAPSGTYKIFNEKKLYYADPGVLSMFSYRLTSGDLRSALAEPFSIVISQSVAAKYFGAEEPLGKLLHLKGSNEDHDYVVRGVMTDPRPDSHLDADTFVSLCTIDRKQGFQYADTYTYAELVSGADLAALQHKLYRVGQRLSSGGERTVQLDAEPISDIHLYSKWIDQIKPSGDPRVVYLLLAIAGLVLAMAWINHVNLATARCFTRAREVGVRKVSGASRLQVASRFMTEVVLVNFAGFGCALLAAYLAAPYFYTYVNVPVPRDYLLKLSVGPWMYYALGSLLAGSLIAGVVPAVTLSALNPVQVLKGKLVIRNHTFSFRKAAVVFQFACAITLTIGVLAFNRQFSFMQRQDLGVDIDKMLVLRAPANVDSTYHRQLQNFRNELKNTTIAEHVSASSSVPGNLIGWTASLSLQMNSQSNGDHFLVNVIDEDFLETYRLPLLGGRNFTGSDFPLRRFGDKVEAVILNRAGMEYLHINSIEEAIDKTVYWGNVECRIIGVVGNFYQQSLKHAIQPQVFIANSGPMLSVRLNEQADMDLQNALGQIRNAWNTYFPRNAFDYFFLGSAFDEQYAMDQQIARVFHFFSLLAVLIAGLGLFALSLLSVQSRTREVGIRKILGASPAQLLHILAREYTLLVGVASLVALPIAYLGIEKWLAGYALHIEPGIWLYALPAVAIILAAYGTIGVHTFELIRKNPCENIKEY